MGRRYDEQVDVRCEGDVDGFGVGDAGGAGAPGVAGWFDVPADVPRAPVAFVWRGRFYDVRAVQARWYERRGWWRDPAGLALLGLRTDAPAAATVVAAATAGEREVWRVEAAAGRSSPVGVYELVHDPCDQPGLAGPAGPAWRLTQVDD